jgi:hypothetical protein
MRQLLRIFAANDGAGFATRLFDAFLQKQSSPRFFDDRQLNRAVAYHDNVKAFCRRALGAPNMGDPTDGKVRIHQALKAARWDINKIVSPTNLGPPAVYNGVKELGWGDWVMGSLWRPMGFSTPTAWRPGIAMIVAWPNTVSRSGSSSTMSSGSTMKTSDGSARKTVNASPRSRRVPELRRGGSYNINTDTRPW